MTGTFSPYIHVPISPSDMRSDAHAIWPNTQKTAIGKSALLNPMRLFSCSVSYSLGAATKCGAPVWSGTTVHDAHHDVTRNRLQKRAKKQCPKSTPRCPPVHLITAKEHIAFRATFLKLNRHKHLGIPLNRQRLRQTRMLTANDCYSRLMSARSSAVGEG